MEEQNYARLYVHSNRKNPQACKFEIIYRLADSRTYFVTTTIPESEITYPLRLSAS